MSFWNRLACQTPSKDLDVSSVNVPVSPGLFKALAILSNAAVRRSTVDQEELKP